MRRRKGFVLVMTLFVLAIVVLVAAGFARHSLNVAVDVQAREREMQMKWGIASCQRVALANAERLLVVDPTTATQQAAAASKSKSQIAVRLGGRSYLVQLADESAKANINILLNAASEQETAQVVGGLAGDFSLVHLKPIESDGDTKKTSIDRLRTWDQVFAGPEGERVFPNELFSLTTSITLWSQHLNFQVATEQVLYEALRPLVGSNIASRVVSAKRDSPDRTVSDVIQSANPTQRQADLLSELLSDRSDTYSVWVSVERDGTTRKSLTVKRVFSSTLFRVYTFHW